MYFIFKLNIGFIFKKNQRILYEKKRFEKSLKSLHNFVHQNILFLYSSLINHLIGFNFLTVYKVSLFYFIYFKYLISMYLCLSWSF